MNRIVKLALFGAFLILLAAVPGTAATYTFGDLYKEWPDHETSLPFINSDEWGSPKIEGAEVKTRENGSLETIKILFDGVHGVGLYNEPSPDYRGDFNSLFINSNWNGSDPYGNWDYYVYGYVISRGSSFGANFYDLTNVNEVYTFAGEPGYRIGHPNGIDTKGLQSVDGYLDFFSVTTDSITYGFVDSKILLGSAFVIGYTPYCANDVFLAPVPEPTTFILLGAGLSLGLLVHRRRKISRISTGDP